MAFENGVNWEPIAPKDRGKYSTFGTALDSALKELLVEKNSFFDSLVDNWKSLFPNLPIRPGRYENGVIYLYVRSAPARFAMEPRMAHVRKTISSLKGAPQRLKVLLEIHP
ncbi:MAG: hypothetical protein J6S51_01370 [Kiritimatiellae bacterium]|nr:hypothetical protein [Kiritimatiellia bacterium]